MKTGFSGFLYKSCRWIQHNAKFRGEYGTLYQCLHSSAKVNYLMTFPKLPVSVPHEKYPPRMLRISIYVSIALSGKTSRNCIVERRGRRVDTEDVPLACGTREQTRMYRGTVGNLVDPLRLSPSCPEGSHAREKCLRRGRLKIEDEENVFHGWIVKFQFHASNKTPKKLFS